MKPYFQLDDRTTIYCGDCRNIIDHLPQVDAVISDPPYGINYHHGAKGTKLPGAVENTQKIFGDDEDFNPEIFLKYCKIQHAGKPGGRHTTMFPMLVWGGNYFADKLPPGYFVCWDKSVGGAAAASFVDCEFAWSTRRNPRNIYRQLWMGVIREKTADETKHRMHPTQKPVGLMHYCIEYLRIGLGKTILDPYMGVGATGVAALRSEKKFRLELLEKKTSQFYSLHSLEHTSCREAKPEQWKEYQTYRKRIEALENEIIDADLNQQRG